MAAFESSPPPEVRPLLQPWRESAIEAARRGPAHARVMAGIIESVFSDPGPSGLDEDARRLVEWLRSMT